MGVAGGVEDRLLPRLAAANWAQKLSNCWEWLRLEKESRLDLSSRMAATLLVDRSMASSEFGETSALIPSENDYSFL